MTRFETDSAETILDWISSPEELRFWTARVDFPLSDASVFDEWHRDPDVAAYVLAADDEPLAYGEIWHDADDGSAELARLLVSPNHRRKGLGRLLVEQLVGVAHDAGLRPIWVRVFAENAAALRCYESAGFLRAQSVQEAEFNANQRFDFVWMALS